MADVVATNGTIRVAGGGIRAMTVAIEAVKCGQGPRPGGVFHRSFTNFRNPG
jgi:hypothetical protein